MNLLRTEAIAVYRKQLNTPYSEVKITIRCMVCSAAKLNWLTDLFLKISVTGYFSQ